jgi:hypothetical protein
MELTESSNTCRHLWDPPEPPAVTENFVNYRTGHGEKSAATLWRPVNYAGYAGHIIAYYEHCLRATRHDAHVMAYRAELRRRRDALTRAFSIFHAYAAKHWATEEQAQLVRICVGDEHAW